MRVPIVFDNLIAAGEMPVTIGIFINPGGHLKRMKPDGKKDGWGVGDNRSFEYDTLSDQYRGVPIRRFCRRWADV